MKTLAALFALAALASFTSTRASETIRAPFAVSSTPHASLPLSLVEFRPSENLLEIAFNLNATRAAVRAALQNGFRGDELSLGGLLPSAIGRMIRVASSGVTLRDTRDSRVTFLVGHAVAAAKPAGHFAWTARVNVTW